MPGINETTEDEELDQIEEVETEEVETEETEESADEPAAEQEEASEDDSGEVVVSFGDEPAQEEEPARAPDWVRDLRKANREKDRRIRELEAREASRAPAVEPIGAKPTLEACDYDSEKFEREYEAWQTRKSAVEAQRRQAEQAERDAKAAWDTKVAAYEKAKTELKVPDYDDAEELFKDTFSVVQQGVILSGADSAEKLVYALGKNPKKARELSSIADPVQFAFAAAKLEAKLKIAPKKKAPLPERSIRGTVAGATAVDNNYDRLDREAQRTGDRSKVAAYLRQKAIQEKEKRRA